MAEKNKNLFIFIVSILFVLILSLVLFFYLKVSFPDLFGVREDISQTKKEEVRAKKYYITEIPTFQVSFFGPESKNKRLEIGFAVSARRDISEDVLAHKQRITDAIIMTTSKYSPSYLFSSEGKIYYKMEIMNKINAILRNNEICQIYYTQFLLK